MKLKRGDTLVCIKDHIVDDFDGHQRLKWLTKNKIYKVTRADETHAWFVVDSGSEKCVEHNDYRRSGILLTLKEVRILKLKKLKDGSR
jgi:hypothetical protein